MSADANPTSISDPEQVKTKQQEYELRRSALRVEWVIGTVGLTLITTIGSWTLQYLEISIKEKDVQLEYLDKFTSAAINQDITERIRLAHYISMTIDDEAYSHLAARWTAYYNALVSACQDRYKAAIGAGDANLARALANEAECAVGGLAPSTPVNSGGTVNLASPVIPPGADDIAALIVSKFGAAGYGPVQQAAALASAIDDSKLNPALIGAEGTSVGLFQLNTVAGWGLGYSVADLSKPGVNIDIVLQQMRDHPIDDAAFRAATTPLEATTIFQRRFMRPANVQSAIVVKNSIAEQLIH